MVLFTFEGEIVYCIINIYIGICEIVYFIMYIGIICGVVCAIKPNVTKD